MKILCPEHEDELRVERDGPRNKWTAICLKCPKRYDLCYYTYYMDPCVKFDKHDALYRTRY